MTFLSRVNLCCSSTSSRLLMIVLFYNNFLTLMACEIIYSAIFHLLKLFSLSVRFCRPRFFLFWRIQEHSHPHIRNMFILCFFNQRENQYYGRAIRQMGTRRGAARDCSDRTQGNLLGLGQSRQGQKQELSPGISVDHKA